jgi:hypothetical protein
MTLNKLALRKLDNDLSADLAQLADVMKDYAAFMKRYGGQMDRHLYRAVASFMTDFYLCAESIFTAIALQLDDNAPRGRTWHKRLIAGMALEVPGVRPAVITPELAAAIMEFLVFRHVVPQAYGSVFEEEQLAALHGRFRQTSERFAREIAAFRTFLARGFRK